MFNFRISEKLQSFTVSIFAVIFFVFIWQFVSLRGIIDPLYIGTPSLVFGELMKIVSSATFKEQVLNSGQSYFLGYFLALIAAIPFGLFLGASKRTYGFFSPLIFSLNSLPYAALLPLLVVWFGTGELAKTVIVFLTVFVPLTIHTFDSTKTVDRSLVQMAKSFKVSDWYIYRDIYLYHAMPSIFTGAKIGVGRGLTAIVVAEIYGLGKGLAYYISFYGATYKTDKLIASILIILLFSVLLSSVVRIMRNRVIYWK